MLPEVIGTERLILRPWVLSDVPEVLRYAADEEWGRYLPVPRPYHEADARRFVDAQLLLDKQQHATWAIEHEGHNVGGVNIRFFCEHRIGEIGYSIARALWGRGLVTEAARAVISHAFDVYRQLERIRAMADARNVASHRVLAKLGMVREGLLRRNRMSRDELVDEVWYGILRSEWIDR